MSNVDRKSTALPPLVRVRRVPLGRNLARVLCALFAIVGLLPLGVTLLVRSDWAQDWAERQTEAMLADQGIRARYEVRVKLWPPALELTNVVIDASDGGSPFLTADKATVKPRIFALLGGKPRVSEVEVDSPRVRVVYKDGKIQNLKLPETKSSDGGPFHAPFDVVALTDSHIEATVNDVRAVADGIDVDVGADDDPTRGSTMEVAVRGGSVEVHRPRATETKVAFDDDQICSIDARVRIEPDGILVRRAQITGAADLDTSEGQTPGCDLLANDKRIVELSLNHLRVDFPKTKGAEPAVEGHVHARIPIGAAERLAKLPDTDGWIGADADLRYVPGMNLPELDGHVEAHDIALDRYHFAQEVAADISIHDDIVKSPKVFVAISGGKVTATNFQVEPFKAGIPLHCAAVVEDVDFTKLMHDLGVAEHPHVAWDIKWAHVPSFGGTIVPLKLDADFDASTPYFGVFDRGADMPGRERIISFSNAHVGAHLAVRDGSVQFRNAYGDLAHSHVEGGYVAIGTTDGSVQVDVTKVDAGLEDIAPIATTHMGGRVHASDFHLLVDMRNKGKIRLESDASVTGFTLADMSLGDVTNVHTSLTDFVLDLKNVRAKKNTSAYGLPSGRIDFKPEGGGIRVDGNATTDGMSLRDLLSVFRLDEDPRFDELKADTTADALFHVALGGAGDACGGGYVQLHATTHLKALELFGEKFDDGDAEFDLRWKDRLAGMNGAELDVHAITLHKVRREKDGSTIGTVLGSVKSDLGGALHGNLVLEGVPLSRLQTLGSIAADAEGTVSGVAQIGGSFDDLKVDTDVDISPITYGGARLGPSMLRVAFEQTNATTVTGHTKCGGAIGPAFDKEAYARDTASHGGIDVTGDLFGGQVSVRKLHMTRQKQAEITGALSLRKLDLGALARMSSQTKATGEVSGEIVIDKVKQGDYPSAIVRFAPSALFVAQEGKKVALRPTGAWLTLASNTVTVSPLTFDLSTPSGMTGSISVQGSARSVMTSPELDFDATLMPLDLGVLVGVVPKLLVAKGTLDGNVHVGGSPKDPTVLGGLRVRDGELSIKDVPGTITGLDADVVADTSELRVSRATAKFSGGTVSITGHAPLKGLSFNGAEADISARGIHLAPQDGVSVGVDADLALTLDAASTDAQKALPHLGGDVTITSAEYTRPINLASDLTSIGVKAKRTEVESYDPALDVLSLDVRVHARAPLRIKNNLAEIQLTTETESVVVSGTNQRFGLRGSLKALPGGRFRLPVGSSVFEVKQAFIRFDDPTRIDPNIDIFAESEYRRGDTTSSTGVSSSSRGGSLWRIFLHVYGSVDDLKTELTSDPPLSQEDIFLLLTVGMTRAEIDQLQSGALGAGLGAGLELATSGASSAVKNAIPVIDDFRFGTAYSIKTGRTEPQVTIGKRITSTVLANVSTGFTEDRELRANVQWRLNNRLSLQGSYDNVTDVAGSSIGNLGVDLRWRLEFQ